MNSRKSYKKLGIFSLIIFIVMICSYVSAAVILRNSNIDIINLINNGHGINFNFNGWGNFHSLNQYTFDDSEINNLTDSVKENLDNIDVLSVDFVSPDLKIENWDKNYVQVNLIGDSSKVKLSKSLTNKTLDVKTKFKKGLLSNFGNLNYKLEIYLPNNYNKKLTLNTQSSNISLSKNTFNTLNINSTSGDVKLSDISATNLSVKTVSSDVIADSINSVSTNISSVSGEIKVNGKLKSFSGKSVSGDLSLMFKNDINSISCNTTSGEVTINAPKDFSPNLEISTVSGSIENDLKLKSSTSSEHKLNGSSLNNIDSKIEVRTVSGDVNLKYSAD
ncbi:DUF4097 family beta strand repeat-containing protein [Inconstantimicrobium mannanitabidum]|uniref:Uncharacterized protein n=1 Tax=Inconstantimicrobium mannanitabidum TaxID=1604901 RepID=A0ACB5RFK3_9CLOT|nr:DUF4097 domain-containing protein [Clostridium sp. TW13]GKX67864.1 hypothetical protein rsdtw13_31220 [Clostridium sp. TW13]